MRHFLLLLLVLAMPAADPSTKTAVLAGGCFWCVEGAFRLVPGVKAVESGYAGGQVDTPTYHQVCAGDTGHAEAVRITYDPVVVSYERLLELFWQVHDPTTLNRQGNDAGTQYRSAIFYVDAAQKASAEAAKAAAQADFSDPIVTEITPLATTGPGRFHLAEDYHQDYYANNPDQPYCRMVVRSKIEKMRKALDHAPAR